MFKYFWKYTQSIGAKEDRTAGEHYPSRIQRVWMQTTRTAIHKMHPTLVAQLAVLYFVIFRLSLISWHLIVKHCQILLMMSPATHQAGP